MSTYIKKIQERARSKLEAYENLYQIADGFLKRKKTIGQLRAAVKAISQLNSEGRSNETKEEDSTKKKE